MIQKIKAKPIIDLTPKKTMVNKDVVDEMKAKIDAKTEKLIKQAKQDGKESYRMHKKDIPKALKKSTGAPSSYTTEKGILICNMLAEGISLKQITKELNIKYLTVWLWLDKQPEFAKLYTRARQVQAEFYADEILSVIDNAESDRNELERARLKSEALKWIASKLKPRVYGDKIDVTSDGERIEQPIYSGLSVVKNPKQVIDAQIVNKPKNLNRGGK